MTDHESARRENLDPERLAMLLDAKLDGAERADLLARLASSPDDLAVLADAAAARSALDPSAEASGGEAFARRALPWRWLALAAAIAGIIAVSLLVRPMQTPIDPARYVALLGSPVLDPTPVLDAPPWTAIRAEGESIALGSAPWRLGARLVDLELALSVHDSVRARHFALEIASLLQLLGVSGATRSVYLEADAIGREQDSAWREEARAARHEIAAQVDDERVTLGAWLETARVAAARENTAFFSAPDSRDAISRLVELGVLTPATGERLATLSARPVPTRVAWDSLGVVLRDGLASR